MKEKLLNTREVADLLGVCLNTVYLMVKRGDLKPVRFSAKLFRFSPQQVADLVERRTK